MAISSNSITASFHKAFNKISNVKYVHKLLYTLKIFRQRKFFGLSKAELHKLNHKHEKHLKRLKKASQFVNGNVNYN